ncbi:MAG: ArsR/SmtB family transcription factor [Thermoleophilia bacterium]
MSHGASPGSPVPIDADLATEVADAFTVMASPGRVLILGRLRAGPASVGELADAAGLSPSATSHQLRMLRHMGWVVRERRGRRIIYSLHDPHVADLLAQAVFHIEHVHAARRASPAAPDRRPSPR